MPKGKPSWNDHFHYPGGPLHPIQIGKQPKICEPDNFANALFMMLMSVFVDMGQPTGVAE